MLAAVNVTAGKMIAQALGATDPNAWVAFAVQAQWENGGAVRGNNPLNLTDPGRRLYWRAYGQTGWYAGGTAAEWHTDFAAFASLEGGARAAAANYLHEGSYGAVITACRSGAGPIPIAQAIQSSPWSTGHYGNGLAPRVSAELQALFAATAAAKLPPQEVHPVSEQLTTFTPPMVGTVPAGRLRRFAASAPHAEILPALELAGPESYEFTGRLVIDSADVPHGTFLVTGTTPPFLVIGAIASFDAPAAAVPDPPAPAPPAVVIAPTSIPAVYSEQDAATLINELAALYPTPTPGEPQHTYTPAMALAQWIQIRKDGAQLPNVTGPGLRFTVGEARNAFDAQTIELGLGIAYAAFEAHGLTATDLAAAMNMLAAELAAGDYGIGGGGFLGA